MDTETARQFIEFTEEKCDLQEQYEDFKEFILQIASGSWQFTDEFESWRKTKAQIPTILRTAT
jgi:hypothetical protein